jgi:hypothetical protein
VMGSRHKRVSSSELILRSICERYDVYQSRCVMNDWQGLGDVFLD